MLGEAGATVYCTGRSIRGTPSILKRPETIEETAAMVTARGGVGVWHQVDHTQPEKVHRFFERVREEQAGHLDILVDNVTGDGHIQLDQSFVNHSLEQGLLSLHGGVHTRVITSYYASQIMIAQSRGLIIVITDGNYIGYNSAGLFYSFDENVCNSLGLFPGKRVESASDYRVGIDTRLSALGADA